MVSLTATVYNSENRREGSLNIEHFNTVYYEYIKRSKIFGAERPRAGSLLVALNVAPPSVQGEQDEVTTYTKPGRYA